MVKEGLKGAEAGLRGAKFLMLPSCAGRPAGDLGNQSAVTRVSLERWMSQQDAKAKVAICLWLLQQEQALQKPGCPIAEQLLWPGVSLRCCFEHQPFFLLCLEAQHCFPRTKFMKSPQES